MLRIRETIQISKKQGRQFLSYWASKIFERSGIKQFFGLNLVAAAFLTGVVSPEATNILNRLTVEEKMKATPISVDIKTETTFETPLSQFRLSQFFSYFHPGIDMVAPADTPIYAIESGTVEFADNSFFGYGKHVIITHNHNIKSLYGHMSEILTKSGRTVSRGELIGKVGSTGWSTGNHLHFEIYYNETAVNPLEVLPIKPEEIVLDGSTKVPNWALRPAITTAPTTVNP